MSVSKPKVLHRLMRSSVNILACFEQAKEITDSVVRAEVEQVLKNAQALEIRNQELETQQKIDELQSSAVESIKDEIAGLQAIVEGREEEYKRIKDIKELEDSMRNAGLDTSRATELVDQRNALKEQTKEMEKMKQMVGQVTGTISSAFTSAFKSVIDGSKSAQEALSDAFKSIGDSFVSMALEIIQQQLVLIANGLIMKALGISMPGSSAGEMPGAFNIGQAFSGRADGGPVSANRPYIVGEEGQELFIPSISGVIVPNDIFEATKDALIEDGEAIPTEDDEAETKAALSANNSSIANTYNSSTGDTESALAENSESINNTYNTTNNGDAEAAALAENSESLNNTYNQSTSSSTSAALAQNRQSIESAYAVNQSYIAAQQMRQSQNAQTEALSSALEPMPTQSFDIKYESMNIGGMEVVTPAQLEKATRVSAMKGRDMALG